METFTLFEQTLMASIFISSITTLLLLEIRKREKEISKQKKFY